MASPRPDPAPPRRPPEPGPAPAPPGEPVVITIKPPAPLPPAAAPAPPPPADDDACYVRNSSFLSQDIEAQKAARRPAEVPPRKSSIPAVPPNTDAAPPPREIPPPVPVTAPKTSATVGPPCVKSPPVTSPPNRSPPVTSPPAVKSPPVKSSLPASVVTSPPQKRTSPPRSDVISPPAAPLKSSAPNTKLDDTAGASRAPWRESPVAREPPARIEKLFPVANDVEQQVAGVVESTTDTGNSNFEQKSEESNGVGDKIKKFEKAAEDAGRVSRPGSVRGRPRTERLGSDNSREDLPPPATPFKDNVQFELGDVQPDRPPTVLERQQSLSRNATAPARRQPAPPDAEKIRPEPQKIIKPEFKPMPSPVDVTIRSPSLGAKIPDRFPSHGTAFRNVAAPDPARTRDPGTPHRVADDVNTQNNFKTCKFKGKEKYSVSKGSSYFTRGSEEIWLVKKKDIEEIEERVLDSFRRAGGGVCAGGAGGRPASEGGQSATMGRTKRHMYARSESLDPQWGARAHTLKRQASVACTCGHDKKARARSVDTAPRPRARSHGADDTHAHVLDKYETLV